MVGVTLEQLFSELSGAQFDGRTQLEEAVVVVVNKHVGELPIGFSYRDAIEAARNAGWLAVTDAGLQVHVDNGVAQAV